MTFLASSNNLIKYAPFQYLAKDVGGDPNSFALFTLIPILPGQEIKRATPSVNYMKSEKKAVVTFNVRGEDNGGHPSVIKEFRTPIYFQSNLAPDYLNVPRIGDYNRVEVVVIYNAENPITRRFSTELAYADTQPGMVAQDRALNVPHNYLYRRSQSPNRVFAQAIIKLSGYHCKFHNCEVEIANGQGNHILASKLSPQQDNSEYTIQLPLISLPSPSGSSQEIFESMAIREDGPSDQVAVSTVSKTGSIDTLE